jgi:hypothetical protein
MINHYYFYCADEGFDPFFLKLALYVPDSAKSCIKG